MMKLKATLKLYIADCCCGFSVFNRRIIVILHEQTQASVYFCNPPNQTALIAS